MKISRGFTIIELIITLAILSFGIIGVYTAFSVALSLKYTITSRFTASYLAQEGLEVVRNLRDINFIRRESNGSIAWSDGLLDCTLGCQLDYKTGTAAQSAQNQLTMYDPGNFLKLNADGFYSYDAGINTIFRRKVTITPESGTDILKVDVVVTWTYNNQPYSFQAYGYLYDWH